MKSGGFAAGALTRFEARHCKGNPDFKKRQKLMKTPMQKITAALGLSRTSADYLDGARQFDREKFIAWCFRAGTTLTIEEIQALRWEHIEGAEVRGPIGLRGTITEASIAQPLADAMAEFRRPVGPIFRYKEWQKTLRYFRTISPPLDPDAVRSKLKPAPAKRAKRCFTPRGPNKVKDKDIPAPITSVATPPIEPVEDLETMKARIAAQYVDKILPEPPEQDAEPKTSRRRSDSLEWPFKKNQAFAAATVVADFLGVSARWVKNQITSGALRGNRMGVVRVELASLRELIEKTAIGLGWRAE
jgi:hypothetical protein